MNPCMDRFRAPDASDEQATCQGCGETFHYEDLSDDGYCKDCREEDEEE